MVKSLEDKKNLHPRMICAKFGLNSQLRHVNYSKMSDQIAVNDFIIVMMPYCPIH